ncbi:MAG: hypothetical protein D6748_12845 [Calditrichaeota bacterium]|nr:MAG: hypothetical protein D6748_12845 [Calditrichota bacterium]
MKKSLLISAVVLGLFMSVILTQSAQAIPAFARKYRTSCSTCHYEFPKLNAFGKAFLNNGLRYPEGQDPDIRKDNPVSLGSEAYKKVWPDAIWPADIDGLVPLSVHAVGRFNYAPEAGGDEEEEEEGGVKSTFEFPHELEVLYAGTIGENVSFMGEIEMENEDNEIEFGFPFWVQWDFNANWHVRLGNVSPDPTPDHLRLTRNHYNVASFRSRNRWRLRDQQSGIELRGAGNGAGGRGGYTFQVGVVNGQGINDANSSKDIYARATYKIGGLGEVGGTQGQGSETSAFYVDNNLRLGGFFYKGTVSGANPDEDITVFGGDLDLWFNRLIVNGAAMFMKSEIPDMADRNSMAWYAQANYVIYPWLIPLVRYEYTDADTDADTPDPQTSLIPALTVVLRANVKITAEYFLPLDDAHKDADQLTLQAQFGF